MDEDERRAEEVTEEISASWSEYRRLVLRELARLNAGMLVLERKMSELEADIRKEGNDSDDKQNRAIRDLEIAVAMLQVKSGVWGGLAGAVVALMAVIGMLIKGH